MTICIGLINKKIIELLGLTCQIDTPIFIGPSNVKHMQSSHAADYLKYAPFIENILSNPDYVGLNTMDDSIEFVKEFKIDKQYVKVAVRVSRSGQYFARSLYTLNSNRVNNFIAKGTLKRI
ncbi:PBECR2 nuclease fold domain-containing protein [Phascolarctobacterium sp.]|uniref:PBECR3 domain-containing polyvalent protein n=1 Tax=Phascolarctobacterium sp. TaxID=2049039 RepID=UPI0025F137F0|nr:PBECR2 nuclease fold domain-containing protein [uncultured Phascolarctobacterium sp.]